MLKGSIVEIGYGERISSIWGSVVVDNTVFAWTCYALEEMDQWYAPILQG